MLNSNLHKMKKIITFLSGTFLILCSCTDTKTETNNYPNFETIEIDSCEYLIAKKAALYQGYGYFSHKGNCKYCKQRTLKENR